MKIITTDGWVHVPAELIPRFFLNKLHIFITDEVIENTEWCNTNYTRLILSGP
jgi:hypothetical protein